MEPRTKQGNWALVGSVLGLDVIRLWFASNNLDAPACHLSIHQTKIHLTTFLVLTS